MSALGHKRTLPVGFAMSALPPKADMVQCNSACPLCANSGHGAHSITSSARANSEAGMATPSDLAVLRLIDSSYLVGA